MSLVPTEIAVRAFVKPKTRVLYNELRQTEILNFTRILFCDTETTVDQYQNLLFGSYKIYHGHVLIDPGVFYEPKLVSSKDVEILMRVYDKVIPVRQFVDEIFLPEVYDAQTLCVGFNLPFDLSRLAIDFGYGRKSNKGSFSLELSKNEKYPRLIIRHIDSTK